MTLEEKIELIRAVSDNLYELHKFAVRDGRKEDASIYIRATLEIDNAINILTDDEYAEKMADIFLNAGSNSTVRV